MRGLHASNVKISQPLTISSQHWINPKGGTSHENSSFPCSLANLSNHAKYISIALGKRAGLQTRGVHINAQRVHLMCHSLRVVGHGCCQPDGAQKHVEAVETGGHEESGTIRAVSDGEGCSSVLQVLVCHEESAQTAGGSKSTQDHLQNGTVSQINQAVAAYFPCWPVNIKH